MHMTDKYSAKLLYRTAAGLLNEWSKTTIPRPDIQGRVEADKLPAYLNFADGATDEEASISVAIIGAKPPCNHCFFDFTHLLPAIATFFRGTLFYEQAYGQDLEDKDTGSMISCSLRMGLHFREDAGVEPQGNEKLVTLNHEESHGLHDKAMISLFDDDYNAKKDLMIVRIYLLLHSTNEVLRREIYSELPEPSLDEDETEEVERILRHVRSSGDLDGDDEEEAKAREQAIDNLKLVQLERFIEDWIPKWIPDFQHFGKLRNDEIPKQPAPTRSSSLSNENEQLGGVGQGQDGVGVGVVVATDAFEADLRNNEESGYQNEEST